MAAEAAAQALAPDFGVGEVVEILCQAPGFGFGRGDDWA